MDLLRAEKERRDEARREAARVANEQRKKEKAAAAESRAVERRAFEEGFQQMLVRITLPNPLSCFCTPKFIKLF